LRRRKAASPTSPVVLVCYVLEQHVWCAKTFWTRKKSVADFLSEEERKQDPYFIGGGEPQPSVISLNSTVSSFGVTMFLNSVAGIPGAARFLNYNALTGTTRPVEIARILIALYARPPVRSPAARAGPLHKRRLVSPNEQSSCKHEFRRKAQSRHAMTRAL